MNTMGIRKSTYIEDHTRVHTWDDPDLGFHAEVKKSFTPGIWIGVVDYQVDRTFSQYQSAVDWVMDQYRLVKAGLDSWDSKAAEMAADQGKAWEDLSDEEAQDFIDAARSSARFGAL